MTVAELLTGVKGPISFQEFVQWIAYSNVKADKEKKASKQGGGRKGRRR